MASASDLFGSNTNINIIKLPSGLLRVQLSYEPIPEGEVIFTGTVKEAENAGIVFFEANY